jgi:hypothetical protein
MIGDPNLVQDHADAIGDLVRLQQMKNNAVEDIENVTQRIANQTTRYKVLVRHFLPEEASSRVDSCPLAARDNGTSLYRS